jgi:hypothetical protein
MINQKEQMINSIIRLLFVIVWGICLYFVLIIYLIGIWLLMYTGFISNLLFHTIILSAGSIFCLMFIILFSVPPLIFNKDAKDGFKKN